jgi:hypothetical protein
MPAHGTARLIRVFTFRFIAFSIGGPALVYYVSPSEEELFKRYNPDLQRKSLENRIGRQQEFDDFVVKLKEYSKSNKSSMASVARMGTCTDYRLNSLGGSSGGGTEGK